MDTVLQYPMLCQSVSKQPAFSLGNHFIVMTSSCVYLSYGNKNNDDKRCVFYVSPPQQLRCGLNEAKGAGMYLV